ncbi:MAG TPA: ABC transporter substrate-binding protein [Bosea sp. (in: a-proteobacteria)]|jgi:iron(III) transport system substrate-binding protein|uniref:ABC transporter substrate-binding protein n=1 Tax=Bosea sp. (in: a-proteobacteria) TaxID=1871050 RepID=UPI002E13CCA2|nr:ABC transporter substrate-binding protein [Bosea sp. (in: a-proteobacteria)]
MLSFLKTSCAAIAFATLAATSALAQATTTTYPAGYSDIVAAAKKEGKVIVYSPTDSGPANALIKAFETKYPGVKVDYNDLSNTAIYNRVVSEFAARQVGGDVVWSVGLDLQVRLVEDGLAERYASPEASHVPGFAKYKDSAYLTSIEPGVILYNKRLVPAALVPKNLTELTKLLKDHKDVFQGKVASWDPEKSGQGYVAMKDDMRHNPGFWPLMSAFGEAGGKIYSNSGQMREKVVSGEEIIAFYVNGAYAAEWVKANPTLGIIYSDDRTSAVSRAALIARNAPHPNAAKLLIDFMLSAEGQKVMGQAGLPSVRSDVDGVPNFKSLNELANGKLQPIALDATLLDNLDKTKRADFFSRWKQAMRR